MRILLIYPHHAHDSHSFFTKLVKVFSYPPKSAFEALADVTPQEHSIEIIDERFEKIDFEEDYDIIGISAMTNQAPRAYTVADEFRRREKKVVLGGWHPSALPEEAKQHADSVVIGEAEDLWPQLLKDIDKGKLKQIYKQERPVDLSSVPITGSGKIKQKAFRSAVTIEATRGCPHGCDFCAITHSPGRRIFRVRPIERVIEEIQLLPQKYLLFRDASLTIDPEYTKRLFKHMKELDKKIFCYGNANVLLRDEELLKLACEAGCIAWAIGFDSVSQKSIDAIGKTTNKVNEYKAVINKIHDFGMNVEGSFMFGFDADTSDIFDCTLDFVCDCELDEAEFYILTPFPGTPLFDRLEKQNRILIRDWSKYDGTNVVFKPKHITAEELIDGIKKMYDGFYNPSNILKIIGRYVNKGFFPLVTITSRSYQGFKYSSKN